MTWSMCYQRNPGLYSRPSALASLGMGPKHAFQHTKVTLLLSIKVHNRFATYSVVCGPGPVASAPPCASPAELESD